MTYRVSFRYHFQRNLDFYSLYPTFLLLSLDPSSSLQETVVKPLFLVYEVNKNAASSFFFSHMLLAISASGIKFNFVVSSHLFDYDMHGLETDTSHSYVEGGMGSVSLAIGNAAKEAGATIVTEAEV